MNCKFYMIHVQMYCNQNTEISSHSYSLIIFIMFMPQAIHPVYVSLLHIIAAATAICFGSEAATTIFFISLVCLVNMVKD